MALNQILLLTYLDSDVFRAMPVVHAWRPYWKFKNYYF